MSLQIAFYRLDTPQPISKDSEVSIVTIPMPETFESLTEKIETLETMLRIYRRKLDNLGRKNIEESAFAIAAKTCHICGKELEPNTTHRCHRSVL